MMIRLQTSKGRDIPNIQDTEISAYEKNWASEIPRLHTSVRIRTNPTAIYNCHGMIFGSRRTRILDTPVIHMILKDDRWEQITELKDVLPGDIIVYVDDQGDLTHSGFVIGNSPLSPEPWICSKWGSGPEVLHKYFDVPQIYGTTYNFYRCLL